MIVLIKLKLWGVKAEVGESLIGKKIIALSCHHDPCFWPPCQSRSPVTIKPLHQVAHPSVIKSLFYFNYLGGMLIMMFNDHDCGIICKNFRGLCFWPSWQSRSFQIYFYTYVLCTFVMVFLLWYIDWYVHFVIMMMFCLVNNINTCDHDGRFFFPHADARFWKLLALVHLNYIQAHIFFKIHFFPLIISCLKLIVVADTRSLIIAYIKELNKRNLYREGTKYRQPSRNFPHLLKLHVHLLLLHAHTCSQRGINLIQFNQILINLIQLNYSFL